MSDDDEDTCKIVVTDEMIDAAERAMWEHAERFNIRTLDEMHRETIRIMILAASLEYRRSNPV